MEIIPWLFLGNHGKYVSLKNALEDISSFELLDKILKEHDLKDKLCQMYNVDESGMPLDAKPPNVCAKRGTMNDRQHIYVKKSHMTVVGRGHAAGAAIPQWLSSIPRPLIRTGQSERFQEPSAVLVNT